MAAGRRVLGAIFQLQRRDRLVPAGAPFGLAAAVCSRVNRVASHQQQPGMGLAAEDIPDDAQPAVLAPAAPARRLARLARAWLRAVRRRANLGALYAQW